MPSGVPIEVDGIVIGGIGVGDAHLEEDVKIAKAELSFLNRLFSKPKIIF